MIKYTGARLYPSFESKKGCWKSVASSEKEVKLNKYGHVACLSNDSMYVFGGCSEAGRFLNSFYVFDTDTNEWEEIQTEIPPPARNFHSMVEHEKIFYLYGGKSNGYHGGLHQFNLETNTWHHSHYVESTQEGNWPIPRFGHSAIVHKEEIIIYGGYDADGYCSGDIYCYSIQENIWKRIIHSNQELELERFHHAACTTENSMLVFGGKSSKGKVCENTLLSYHYDTDTWSIIETVGTAPCRRWGHCSATQGGYMYIFGGYDGHSEFADLYQYKFNSRTWMIVEVDWCPAPRYFSSAVSIDGTIYVYGGKNQISKCFGDVYAIQLESPQATIKEKKRKQKKDKEKRNANSTEKQRGKKNWEKKKRKPAGGEMMKVKCYFQGEIRILGIPRSMTYEELMDKLTTEYRDSLLLQYNGTNGDVITVRSQSDMDKMRMRHRNTHSMKVYLTSYYPSLPYMDAGTIPKHPLEKVQVTKTLLGKGGVGEVYLGMNFDTGELIAVKQVRVQGTDAEQETIIKSLQQEIQVMQKLNHVNIVRYLGSRRSEAILNIYLEFIPGGSIHHLLTKFGHFSEEVTRLFTYQILCGLDYLHDNRIVHRDIKGANILVDNNGTIKLSDFGAAKQLSDILSGASTITGTPHWVAPEVANGEVESYGRKADIWSLGAVIIEMITGKPPFSDLAPLQALVKLGTTNILPDIPDKLSPEGKTFLSRCFQRDPELRASTKELLEHPYMQSMGRESLTKSADDKVFVPRELLFNERMASPASGSMEAFQPSPDSYFSEFNSIVSFLRSSSRKAGPLK